MQSYLGTHAQQQGAKEVLSGEVPETILDELQPETVQLLHTMSTPSHQTTVPVDIDIAVEDFISCYKVVKGQTASSSSGRHVGKYKASIHQHQLAQLNAAMMTIPLKVGFSLKRWRRIVGIMLEKQPGNSRIHRLCIIALMESDFNQACTCTFLSKFHLNQHTAWAIVFSPQSLGGLQLPDMLTVQGIGQQQLFHGRLQLNDKTTRLILIDLSYLQLLAGTTEMILNTPRASRGQYMEGG